MRKRGQVGTGFLDEGFPLLIRSFITLDGLLERFMCRKKAEKASYNRELLGFFLMKMVIASLTI